MNDHPFRCFGIIPSAGSSRRMGESKLLLPYRGTTLIKWVLAQWMASQVTEIILVLNRTQESLVDECRSAGVVCLIPDPLPVEMKRSVQAALRWLEQNRDPQPGDAWLLAPADLPEITQEAIDLVVESYRPGSRQIVVPQHQGRRGHPAMFPWCCSRAVFELAEEAGVNALLNQYPVTTVDVHDAGILNDIDTPDDYRRLKP